jgi:dihydroflavonol-4-reductase
MQPWARDKCVVAGRFVPRVDVGVGVVDVRDFADGMPLAAERGRPGQRYVLYAHNPTLKDLVAEVAALAGPGHVPGTCRGGCHAFWSLPWWPRIRGKEPPVPPTIAKLIAATAGTTPAECEDLGWRPRPLHETLADTVRWFREHPSLPKHHVLERLAKASFQCVRHPKRGVDYS